MLARASASPAQGLRHLQPRYFKFLIFVQCVALRNLDFFYQNWLERNMSGLLLRTLVVGRRQQSESIAVALYME